MLLDAVFPYVRIVVKMMVFNCDLWFVFPAAGMSRNLDELMHQDTSTDFLM